MNNLFYPLRSIAISAKTDPNAGESIKVKDGVLHNVGVAYVARKSIGIDTLLVQELVLGLLIAPLNLSVLGFSFVFHDKAKRTQQGDLLALRVFRAKASW